VSAFSLREREPEVTGLDYFGARYYGAAQGRFTSSDPYDVIMDSASQEEFDSFLADPQHWNRYAYALNNPLKFIDPSGLDPISVEDCQKDSSCVVVKVNVVLDKGAQIFDQKGNLQQQYQDKLNAQIAEARDEYGTANIALDVAITTGGRDNISKNAINVLVTDSSESYANSSSTVGGTDFVRLNAGTSRTNTLSHEIAHILTGNTRLPAFMGIFDAVADVFNDAGRSYLRSTTRAGSRTPGISSLQAFDASGLSHFGQLVHYNARRWYGRR
jgi:RHS repeat-associated protein